MEFTFEGSRFRLLFGYDRSRNWSDHRGHEVSFVNVKVPCQFKKGRAGERVVSKPQLWCKKCNTQLSGTRHEMRRLVRCTLFVMHGRTWESIGTGIGRLRKRELFVRSKGRMAAMADLMEREGKPMNTPAFRSAAWDAFHARLPFRRSRPATLDATG